MIEEICVWLEDKLRDQGIVGRVRLPTRAEWLELAKHETGWTRPVLKACNLSFDNRETRLSVVGSFPLSCSIYGCYDVLGNAWEICQEESKFFIAGWSHHNSITGHRYSSWDHIMELQGKAKGEPVTIRFVVEALEYARKPNRSQN